MDHRLERIDTRIQQSIDAKQRIGDALKERIVQAVDRILQTHREGGRIWIAGNGGSAADAQHFSCELVGRFLKDREPVDATALTTNSSTLTAVGNDFSADMVFVRQIKAHARPGDIFVAISTSGRSSNILEAAREAQNIGAFVIAMTGQGGGDLKDRCDLLLDVPSAATPRIQECHILIIHMICELVEDELE